MTVTNVIVGGAFGIGEAVARAFADRGRVLVADRDLAAARRAATAVGADSEAVQCDVTVDADIAALAARVDRLGALVVTAGLSPQMAKGDLIWSVNLLGTAKILDAFLPKVGGGSVAVCFASCASYLSVPPEPVLPVIDDPMAPDLLGRLAAAGLDPNEPTGAYSFSKVGVRRLVSRLASPWGVKGGRILSLSAGVIDTQMGRMAADDEATLVRESMAHWPIPRFGSAEEIASVVAFLCSRDASYMTGCDVLVDGGFVAAYTKSEHHNVGKG